MPYVEILVPSTEASPAANAHLMHLAQIRMDNIPRVGETLNFYDSEGVEIGRYELRVTKVGHNFMLSNPYSKHTSVADIILCCETVQPWFPGLPQ